MKIYRNLILAFAFLLTGCAASTQSLLQDGVGKITYEDAVKMFGTPLSVVYGTRKDGKVIMATWERLARRFKPFRGAYSMTEKISLFFDPETKILKDYSYITY